MFQHFFYTLQEFGLKVTLGEWLTLQEALDKGLANSSLTDFYYLARMILVKSETDYEPIFQRQLERCGVDYFDFYLLHAGMA